MWKRGGRLQKSLEEQTEVKSLGTSQQKTELGQSCPEMQICWKFRLDFFFPQLLFPEIFEGLLPETIAKILNHATGTTEN